MPHPLSKIIRFESITLHSLKEVQVQPPDSFDVSSCLEIDISTEYILVDEKLPIKSKVDLYPLLESGNTITPITLPLAYEGVESIASAVLEMFSALEITENKDLFIENKLVTPQTIEVSIDVLKSLDIVKISENLLQKLKPLEEVSGMLYRDRYWTVEKLPDYFGKQDGNRKKKKETPNHRDLHEIGGQRSVRPRYKPSFWDLLFVLLQPPLDINQTDSLFLPHDLYAYQVEGVKFLVSNKHALLADDMGTGKTVMSIVALKLLMHHNDAKRGLILCPPSVLHQWMEHLAEWFPEIITCLVRGTPEIRSLEWNTPANVYVTTYDTLRSDIDNGLISRDKWDYFDSVIIDEAHHIKNPESSRSKAIRKLRPSYRWGLTGTPIQNKIEDMAAIFDFIYPGLIVQWDLYEQRIKQKVAPYFLRRRKQEVLKDLPPKLKQDFWLEMSDSQKAEYFKVEREAQAEIEGLGMNITKMHIFAKMQKLKQICNFPSASNTSPKLETLKEQIEDVVESGNKVIIFSQYVDQGVNKLEKALNPYGVAKIVGGQSDSERRHEIERFKSSDKTPILIASVKSGGEGLNLTEASYVVHFDHWWNPAVMWQAEDRVHRRGQKQNVNVYSYWMSETIDDRIYKILKRKGLMFENIVDGLSEDSIDELFTMNDLLEIMGVRKPVQQAPTFNLQRWQKLNRDQIYQKLFETTPVEFEELVQQLMHYIGYPNVRVTKKTGDGGIDVLSTRITEKGIERIAAQCKRYRQPVGVHIAREFQGAIHDDKSIVKGYLVVTSDFTSECRTYCDRNNIEMINGIQIAEYILKFGLEREPGW